MLEQFLFSLLDLQNPDGGWGARSSGPSQTEATSLAIVALETSGDGRFIEAARKGKTWLYARQRPDGAWPRSDDVPEPSWMTSLAMIALQRDVNDLPRVLNGAAWLLESKGRASSRFRRLLIRLAGNPPETELDEDLRGWPWRPETFGWIEPTAYALLALKMIRLDLPSNLNRARIRDGELMILDRMCPGGGWNYGNSRVLGEDLWPYPDTTALALIAIQDLPRTESVEESLRALERMTLESSSGLSLALATLCFRLHGIDRPELRQKLEAQWEETAFLGETRPTAFAAIAVQDQDSPFRVGRDA